MTGNRRNPRRGTSPSPPGTNDADASRVGNAGVSERCQCHVMKVRVAETNRVDAPVRAPRRDARRATRRDGTHVNLEVFVQVVRQDQVVRHGEPVGFHRVVVPVVRRPDVRVVEVRDAVLRGRHRGGAKTRPPSPPSRSPRAADNPERVFSTQAPSCRGARKICKRAPIRRSLFFLRSPRTARFSSTRKRDETTSGERASSADFLSSRVVIEGPGRGACHHKARASTLDASVFV